MIESLTGTLIAKSTLTFSQSSMYLTDQSFDDLLRRVVSAVLKRGRLTSPTKGKARELTGVLLKLTNPRARLSLAEKRSVTFSALGELFWYLSKKNSLEFIEYYIAKYKEFSDDGRSVWGAYGPRLFKMRGHDQIQNVITLLRKKRDSRRAAIQLFNAEDLAQDHEDVPCTCSLQFLIRDDRLHMFTMMRSNDAYLGLPHDVFTLTMMQEVVARSLGVELGTYSHAVGSLHVYTKNEAEARAYLDQGWQEKASMPPMPEGDPFAAIPAVLRAEGRLRKGESIDVSKLKLDDYWKDLVRLLQVYRHFRDKKPASIGDVQKEMSSRVYDPLIDFKRASVSRQVTKNGKKSSAPRDR